MKIGLPMQDDILYKNNIDTVILNTATRTGQGYCQSQRFCEKTGEQGEVNFDDYYRLTPFDWKNDIQSAKQVGTERKDGRDLLLVEVNGDYTFVIDKFFGVPLKIIQGKEEKYVYDNVDFNTVVDSDFEFKLTDRDY